MAESIYEGCESVEGIVTNVYDLASIEEQNMIKILEESDGILIELPPLMQMPQNLFGIYFRV